MSYQVPQHIDNNKVFIVNHSQIEGRLDPHYYKPFYSKKWHLLSHQDYKLGKLKDNSICLFSGITPKSGGDAYVTTGGVPFIRSGDFSETNEIDFSQLLYIKKEIHQELMRSSQLKKGDLLIAIVGATIGKIGVYQYDVDANINQAICAVRLKDNISPYYVQAFFQTSVGQKIIERIKRPVARANINIEEVGNFPIPMLSPHRQLNVVQLIEDGINLKMKKSREARQLLEEIDTYLLKELGITLPEVHDNLNNRMFILNRSEMEGRFDPTVYKDGIKLISPIWDNVKLSRVAYVNPEWTYKGKTAKTVISFVPMEVIDETFSEITTMDETTIEQSSGFTKFKEGDLLWAKITPCMQNGKSAIAKKLTNGLGCGSTEFFILRPKDERLTIEYLHVILHMKCVRETAMLYFGGSAGQQRVPASFLENFNIPLPPKEKQVEIANHVYELRQQAKILQVEGKHILEAAKQEVEQMIIGQ